MMSDFEGIDFTNVESTQGESASYIPKGDYNCIIDECVPHLSASGNKSIKLVVKVHNEPQYNNWVLRKYFSLWYTNDDNEKQEMVRGYAASDFKRLLTAVGLQTPPNDATSLQGKTLVCTVSEKDNSENENPSYRETSNEIVAFRSPKDDGMSPPKKADVPPSMAGMETGKPSL
tara:strand:- start:1 stop:522 length:522 start_codon:yes stop_codon:yes gene_type:complete